MKKILFVVTLSLLFTSVFISCDKDDDNEKKIPIVGTYSSELFEIKITKHSSDPAREGYVYVSLYSDNENILAYLSGGVSPSASWGAFLCSQYRLFKPDELLAGEKLGLARDCNNDYELSDYKRYLPNIYDLLTNFENFNEKDLDYHYRIFYSMQFIDENNIKLTTEVIYLENGGTPMYNGETGELIYGEIVHTNTITLEKQQ